MRATNLYWAMALVFSLGPAVSAEDEPLLAEISQRARVIVDEQDPARPVVEIWFSCGAAISDHLLARLSAFPKLRRLGLIGGQNISDEGLRHLGNLTELTEVRLRNHKVSAAGLKHLAALPKLQTLYLWHEKLPEDAWPVLGGCPSLESFEFRGVHATESAVATLGGMPKLKRVSTLRGNGVFDKSQAKALQEALPHIQVTVH